MGERTVALMVWTTLVALSVVSMVLASDVGAQEQIGARRSSTVQLHVTTCDGLRSGTGVIADGVVLTNRHVVDGALEVEVTTERGRQLVASGMSVHPTVDLAVVEIEDAPRGARLADDPPAVGDDLVISGHPGSMDRTEERASVDALMATGLVGDPTVVVRGDAAVVAGHSGSPAFDERGEVAALVYAAEHGSQRALMIGSAELRGAVASAVPQAVGRCG